MKRFLPDMYYENIFKINYEKLKKLKIKVLMFDFDNTIMEKGNKNIKKELIDLFKNLKKDFDVYILSNTFSLEKIRNLTNQCEIKYVIKALKPTRFGFLKIQKLSQVEKNNMCMIGDQLLTDIYGANKLGIKSILVNYLNANESKITRFNRKFENRIIKRLNKQYKFERNKFYD